LLQFGPEHFGVAEIRHPTGRISDGLRTALKTYIAPWFLSDSVLI
jgi:hypothetical protein